MSADSRTMLIVEDDSPLRDRLVRAMRDRGFDAQGVADHTAALEAARQDSPELALVDLKLPGESGLRVIRELIELDPATVVVVLTGYGSIATAVESIKLGAASYLTKPADADQIVAAFGGIQPADDAEVPSLARVEWEHIQRVLTDCGGNVSKAARLLGIHRRSLQRKLSKNPGVRF
jgi:two-component system response regulator RegA